ncbi:MAG: BMC domain-containing protein [Candidatus Eisenbacteria bacterium]|nr:BMC domain-containing protein [Candidatus Eisenbacteria bacterium]
MEALALLELDSIAGGYRAADALMKAARVRLLEMRPLDPGKFLILFRGPVGEVDAAYRRGRETAGEDLVDEVYLPAAHPSLFPLLEGKRPAASIEALGVIETGSAASAVCAADAAAKAAEVALLRVHLARRIGGKGYLLLTGGQADVEAAVAAGAARARERERLVAEVVIPAPTEEIFERLTAEWL